jgi:hypothetical protein
MSQKQTFERIISYIECAQNERKMALSPENRDRLGYPYVTGYTMSCLSQIKEMVEEML